jgi:hypothetical protein
MPMDRADRIGTGLSAALHIGVIAWVAFGGALLRPRHAPPVRMTEVSVMSQAEYDAMIAAAPKPSDAPVTAPQVPLADAATPAATPEAQAPLRSATEPLAPPETATEPPLEPLETVPPVAEVPDAPPTPPAPPVTEPSPSPEVSPAPQPRPVPRVAPVPAEAPPPDAAVSDTSVAAVAPQATPEAVPVEQPPTEAAAPPEATTQIVTEATPTVAEPLASAPASSPRPQARPVRPAAPVQTAAPAKPPRDAVADALAEALATPTGAGTGGAGTAPSGPPLTAGEKDALVLAVKACWNVGALSTDALRTTVTIGVSMQRDGRPDAASIHRIAAEGGTEASAAQAYEAARRAIIRCGANGFPLPAEKYDQWAQVEIVFNPEKMRMK